MKKIIYFATWLFVFVAVVTPVHAKPSKKRTKISKEIPVKDPLENRIQPSSSRYTNIK